MLIDLLPSDVPLIPAPAGKVIFAQGDPGEVMYVVIEGQAQIMIDGKLLERCARAGSSERWR